MTADGEDALERWKGAFPRHLGYDVAAAVATMPVGRVANPGGSVFSVGSIDSDRRPVGLTVGGEVLQIPGRFYGDAMNVRLTHSTIPAPRPPRSTGMCFSRTPVSSNSPVSEWRVISTATTAECTSNRPTIRVTNCCGSCNRSWGQAVRPAWKRSRETRPGLPDRLFPDRAVSSVTRPSRAMRRRERSSRSATGCPRWVRIAGRTTPLVPAGSRLTALSERTARQGIRLPPSASAGWVEDHRAPPRRLGRHS